MRSEKKTLLQISILALLLHCAAGQNKLSKDAVSGYARILIPDYVDATGSTDFAYLSASLGDATREAMRGKFAFRDVPQGTRMTSSMNPDAVLQVADGSSADILILGEFQRSGVSHNAKKSRIAAEKIMVTGKIYSVRQKKLIGAFSQEAVVDARIFSTVNEIAQNAVKGIQDYLKKVGDEAPEIDGATGKQALTLKRLKLKVFVPPMF